MTAFLHRLAAAVAAVVLFVLAGASAAVAVDRISVAVPNPPHVSNALFFLGEELGFWREDGLEVEVVNVDSTGAMMPQLAAKRVTFGYPNPEVLVLARQPGKDYLPLRFVYNVVRSSIWEVTVLDSSPVRQLRDLKGGKLGVTSLGAGNVPLTRAMFADIGLTVGKDLELVAVGISSIARQAITTKQVDALNLFDMVNVQLERSGVPLRQIPIDERYKRLFSNGFITHDDTIKNNGDLVARFGRAWSKAALACDANTAACVEAFWRARPALRPAKDREEAELADNIAVLKTRLARVAVPEGTPWGAYDEAAWTYLVKLLHEQGQLSTDKIPVDTLYTNAFVDEYNKFDGAAVIAKAKAYRAPQR